MSGRDKFGGPPGAVRSFMEKLKRTVSDAEETKNTLNQGYRRVETAESTLSTSTTATSLDQFEGTSSELQTFPQRPFKPILETEIADEKSSSGRPQSVKTSRVSFDEQDEDDHFSDDENFHTRRHQFQQRKTKSVDHKGILKDLRHILDNDNRRAFQSKKHVSLDVNNTKQFEDLLKGSSSEDDFANKRQHFQGRKHQSLDSRVTFKLDKEPSTSSSSDEEFESNSLIQFVDKYDITKPVIIDLKDLESSEDEDFVTTRKSFQKSKSLSLESRRSRFFEMDEINSLKGDNIRTIVPFVRQITEEGKPKLEVYRPTTNPIYIYTQILAALSVSLGSLSVGFSSAYSSPATESMYNRNITSFEVSKDMGSWVGGIMPLAGLIGGIIGGPLIEYLGRKTTIMATGVPFILSWLLIGFAIDVSMVLAGRFLSGLCVGIASLALPVYLGETVQPEVRGTLGLLPTAFGNIGILLGFTAGRYLHWDHLAFFGGVLPIPFLALMIMIPETPRWHVGHGSEEKARVALQWLRGKQADVEPELKGIVKSHMEAERHAAGNPFMELIKVKHLKPLAISLGLMFFQQLSGINAVIFFSETIFKESGSTIDKSVCSIIVGVVNFLATFVATALIDSLGRKILLYISSVTMVITLGTLSGFLFAKDSFGADVSNIGWLPLMCFVVYVIGFSVGFGPIPWLMMGEILPAKIRGTAASVATGFNWSCTFVVTKTFGNIAAATGYHGAFAIFGVVCFIGLFFVIFCVPETQGKTLEDIERKMMGRVRRMSSVANIKPLAFNM